MKANKILGMAAVVAACSVMVCGAAFAARPTHLWLGGDISATTYDESRGVFSTDTLGRRTENTQLMKDYGMDAVRLRVWVDPEGGWSSKEDVLTMAKRAKALGMEVMVDFHYSDWWADPGKQNKPAAWKDFDMKGLEKALYDHTHETLKLLKDNGIDVKWVQVGNETTNGFLWPTANIHADVNPQGMDNYAELTKAGYDAVKAVYPEADVIIHLDNGFDQTLYDRVFDALKERGVKWDIIGMSVYPFWAMEGGREPDAESTIRDAVANMRHLKKKYGTDVMVVEVGMESEKPVEGKAELDMLMDMVIDDADGACTGVFYWAPECYRSKDAEGNVHGYALGAFTNGMTDSKSPRPTEIMKSFTRAAEKMKGK